jgi:hypothetical protein
MSDRHVICHQCGEDGLDPERDDVPCRECGWDRDDGLAITYARLLE